MGRWFPRGRNRPRGLSLIVDDYISISKIKNWSNLEQIKKSWRILWGKSRPIMGCRAAHESRHPGGRVAVLWKWGVLRASRRHVTNRLIHISTQRQPNCFRPTLEMPCLLADSELPSVISTKTSRVGRLRHCNFFSFLTLFPLHNFINDSIYCEAFSTLH